MDKSIYDDIRSANQIIDATERVEANPQRLKLTYEDEDGVIKLNQFFVQEALNDIAEVVIEALKAKRYCEVYKVIHCKEYTE